MHTFTNLQFLHSSSKTIVFLLPGARGSCNSKSQTDMATYFINQGISCISMNYYHQDNKEPFTMATYYEQKKQELFDQVKEFRESIDTKQYENIILIGTSLGGVLFNQLMDYFGGRVKQLFILGYLTGYIDTNKLTCPTVIIQGEYDKYGGINIVKENIIGNVENIIFHEITNADHSYYDIHNPSIRYINEVNQIITNTIIKS